MKVGEWINKEKELYFYQVKVKNKLLLGFKKNWRCRKKYIGWERNQEWKCERFKPFAICTKFLFRLPSLTFIPTFIINITCIFSFPRKYKHHYFKPHFVWPLNHFSQFSIFFFHKKWVNFTLFHLTEILSNSIVYINYYFH